MRGLWGCRLGLVLLACGLVIDGARLGRLRTLLAPFLPRFFALGHESKQLLVLFRSALLAIVALTLPVRVLLGQVEAPVVLPYVAFVAANHLGAKVALIATHASNDGVLFLLILILVFLLSGSRLRARGGG